MTHASERRIITALAALKETPRSLADKLKRLKAKVNGEVRAHGHYVQHWLKVLHRNRAAPKLAIDH